MKITLSNAHLDSLFADREAFEPYLHKRPDWCSPWGCRCDTGHGHIFFDPSGTNHYRLLHYLASLLEGKRIIDLGTHMGL
jgi:hypothetical protein